jgi:hypothetical protein
LFFQCLFFDVLSLSRSIFSDLSFLGNIAKTSVFFSRIHKDCVSFH